MESLFNQFLEKRGYTRCPLPLWKLKITDDEYVELRTFLANTWRSWHSFRTCPREAALYMAEWWKRDPDMGEESGLENRLFLSLGLGENAAGKEDFIKNSRRVMDERDRAFLGFKPLVIRHRQNDAAGVRNRKHTTYYVFTLFYQGGFPMGKACSGRGYNKWAVCIPKFTKSNLSLGDIPGNVIASKLLGEYKDVLVAAAREKRPDMMPFACDSKNHPWYRLAVEGIDKGISDMEGRPFRITWTIDFRNETGTLRCSIHGNAELKENFLKFHSSAKELDSLTIQLYEDGRFIQNIAEYSAFDGREGREFISFADTNLSVDYHEGAKISLRIAETGEVIGSSSFDMGVPHAFFWNGFTFAAGSRFGTNRSIILFRTPWIVEEKPDGVLERKVSINGEEYSYLDSLPEADGSYFVLLNSITGDSYENGSDAKSPEWAEVEIKPVVMFGLLKEKVADFSDNNAFTVFKCTSDEDKEMVLPGKYLFRGKGEDKWSTTPPLGRISCAVAERNANNGNPVTLPENDLFNVGPGLSIIRSKCQPFATRYLLSWDGGEIFINSPDAQRDGEEWVCEKTLFPNIIPLHLIPHQGEPFDLTLRTTYRQTAIFSPYGENVETGEIIPVSQLSEYQYKFTDIHQFRLHCNNKAFNVTISNAYTGEDFSRIPEEGPLNLPLSKSFLVPFMHELEEGCVIDFRTIQFLLMDYPLVLDFLAEERAFCLKLRKPLVSSDDWNQNQTKIVSRFKGNLILSSLVDGTTIEIPRSDNDRFKVPDSLAGDFAVASTIRGYIRPFIINVDNGLVSAVDHDREKEALMSTPLNTGGWSLASRFLDLGLRYSLSIINLPWIGTVFLDGILLSLHLFQEFARDLVNPSAENIVMARLITAGRDIPVPEFPDKPTLQFLIEASAGPEAFKQGFEIWKSFSGVDEGKDLFKQYLDAALTREQDFMDKLLND